MSTSPDTDSVEDLLNRVKDTTTNLNEIPYCSGTYGLTGDTGNIAYRKTPDGFDSGWLDFASGNLGESDLQGLVQACEAATFGRGSENVLDPSYREAWKLDLPRFCTQIDVVQSGLLSLIRNELLRHHEISSNIEAHLYKLNVYGPGSHFKSHVDTPRSDRMFGSLVIVLPTEHVGGDLILRSKGTTWTFESSKMLSKSLESGGATPATPHFAWVAFYSDTEHEVSVVTSGYRVTLTSISTIPT